MLRPDERGIALLLALLVLTLLTTLILEFDADARREYQDAAAFRDSFKARMLTRAAVQAAQAVLRKDWQRDNESGEFFDGPTDLWAMPIKNYVIGDGLLSVRIEDERGKLNLNDLAINSRDELLMKAKIQRVKRLFELAQVNPDLVDALVDWVDRDEQPQPAGAESLYYQSQKPAYRSANGPLPSLDDLRLVKGFTPEIVDRLSRYVTVFPEEGGGPMNFNTTDPLVMQALDQRITQPMAMAIVQGRPYRSTKDLDGVGSLQPIAVDLRARQFYEVKSDVFSARLTVTVNDVTQSSLAILHRDGATGDSTLLYLRAL